MLKNVRQHVEQVESLVLPQFNTEFRPTMESIRSMHSTFKMKLNRTATVSRRNYNTKTTTNRLSVMADSTLRPTSVTYASNTPHGTNFLSLPPEIRNIIYSLTLPSPRSRALGPPPPGSPPRFAISLLSTCRQIRSETSLILYFYIDAPFDSPLALKTWLAQVGSQARLIRVMGINYDFDSDLVDCLSQLQRFSSSLGLVILSGPGSRLPPSRRFAIRHPILGTDITTYLRAFVGRRCESFQHQRAWWKSELKALEYFRGYVFSRTEELVKETEREIEAAERLLRGHGEYTSYGVHRCSGETRAS